MLTFTVSLPAAEGFVGRSCKNRNCGRYFKAHVDSLKDKMFCPYCGEQFERNDLLTPEQSRYVKEVAKQKAIEYAHEEISKKLKSTFGGNKASGGFFKITAELSPLKRQPVFLPQERKVDSELECPSCKFRFQVYGIFGLCPGCRTENILIYDANLEIIRQEVRRSSDQQRALRHAYGDLVSAFESFCRRRAQGITKEKVNFQNLEIAETFLRENLKIELFSGLVSWN